MPAASLSVAAETLPAAASKHYAPGAYERRLRVCEADFYTAELDIAKGARDDARRCSSPPSMAARRRRPRRPSRKRSFSASPRPETDQISTFASKKPIPR